MFLKQSTAAVVSFGPFVDETDGVTLVASLVSAIDHATTGIKLSKAGGALTIRSQAVTASTYDANGNYLVTLSTTDTGTVGRLRMQFTDATTNVPVWQDFFVLPAAIYDWLTAGAAPLTPTTAGRTLDVSATGEAGVDWANVGSPTTTVALTGTTTADNTTALTEGYAADGATATAAQLLYMIWAFLNAQSFSGVTKTSKKLDKSTTAMTHAIDNAAQASSISRAS